ncbi:MAG TPA: hypothetical protein VF234_10705, partial [Limnochordia bacterium]
MIARAARTACLASPAWLTVATTVAPVQAQTPEACAEVLASIAAGVPPGNDPCQSLAVALATGSPAVDAAFSRATDPAGIDPGAALGQRELQPHHAQHAALAGSLAQPEAVADVRPAPVAAGSVAALGSDFGRQALAALAVNPAIFLLSDVVSREFARFTRFADLSLLVPLTEEEGEDGGSIDYVGVRLRVNYHGLSAGDQLWSRARELLLRWIDDAARRTVRVRELLASAPNLQLCADALWRETEPEPAAVACGGSVDFGVTEAEIEALRQEFEAIRRVVDASYLGADIRLDFGDPTLGEEANASGTYVFAGIAAGQSLGFAATDLGGLGARARLGLRYASLNAAEAEAQLQVEGGLGVELTRALAASELSAGAGLEFRYGGEDEGIYA